MDMLKKTKIVCTMGPSVEKEGIIEALLKNGMNVARFNFSHGDHAEHLARIEKVREAGKAVGKMPSLMLDTKGPEMRLGVFADGKVQLEAGKKFVLTIDESVPGTAERVSVNHKNLYKEVKPGNTILLSDGLVSLKVEAIQGTDIVTTIMNSGIMGTRKRVAAPGVSVSLPPISDRDRADILFGIQNDMDFVAASFIQRAADVRSIRQLIEENGGKMEIISKIENMEGVQNIDEILEASDGIMVARGDLGVEIPAEDVPLIQKMIIEKCNKAGKPVIVATQMLESMINNPRPTRAEASDVANAIMDGTDAIMLSGETASGDYPVEAVQTMNKIAHRIENSLQYNELLLNRGIERQENTTEAISHATVQIAYELDAAAIVTPTESGYTARMVSKYRPKAGVVAVTPNPKTQRLLNLRWGVYPIVGSCWNDTDEMITGAMSTAVKEGYLKEGDIAVVTAGITLSAAGNTNMIKVHTV